MSVSAIHGCFIDGEEKFSNLGFEPHICKVMNVLKKINIGRYQLCETVKGETRCLTKPFLLSNSRYQTR